MIENYWRLFHTYVKHEKMSVDFDNKDSRVDKII